MRKQGSRKSNINIQRTKGHLDRKRTEPPPDRGHKTVSLSLNFNNENQYRFAVEIPPIVDLDEACNLCGVNSRGKKFKLGGLGTVLVRVLVELGHATKRYAMGDYYYLSGYCKVHAPRKGRGFAAAYAEVKNDPRS